MQGVLEVSIFLVSYIRSPVTDMQLVCRDANGISAMNNWQAIRRKNFNARKEEKGG